MKTPLGNKIFSLITTLRLPFVLMDYPTPYFYFAMTDTSWDDFIMATRNKLWVDSLPANWQGVGVVFGGQALVMQTPNFDFQNSYQNRFPGRPFKFLDIDSQCK